MSSVIQGDDAPLLYHWRAPEDAVRLLSMPVASHRDTRASDASLLAAALLEHDGANRFISYSRSSDLWNSGIYEGTTYSKRRVVPFIDQLTEYGWVENDVAPPQPLGVDPDEDLSKRWQSRFRATERMADRLRGIVLDHRGPSSPVILRDAEGAMLPLPRTDRVHRLRRGVDAVNAGLAGLRVTVSPDADPANWRRSAYHLRARKVRGDGSETWACTLPTPDPHVVRIFSRGSFDLHGRYYGWWQGLPKERRAELLINGEVLVEPDFHWLHPSLLYALAGHAIAYDPYTTGYWPRQAGKLAFNTYLNAPTTEQAIGGLLKKRHEKGDDGEPVWKYGHRATARILDDIKGANPHVAHLFGSDAGVRLMAIDSGMAERVMKACRKASIPCLPVHDSFMVPASKGAVVEGIMASVLDETLATIKSKVSRGSPEMFLHNAPLSSGGPGPEALGEALPPSGNPSPEGPGEPLSLPGNRGLLEGTADLLEEPLALVTPAVPLQGTADLPKEPRASEPLSLPFLGTAGLLEEPRSWEALSLPFQGPAALSKEPQTLPCMAPPWPLLTPFEEPQTLVPILRPLEPILMRETQNPETRYNMCLGVERRVGKVAPSLIPEFEAAELAAGRDPWDLPPPVAKYAPGPWDDEPSDVVAGLDLAYDAASLTRSFAPRM